MSKLVIGLCAFVLLVITPSVQADPIVITSGSLTVTGPSGSPTYSISGNNFSVTSVGGDSGNTPNCLPCLPGQLAPVSSFLVGSSLGHGPATINGVSFAELFYSGTFSLGAAVLLPTGVTTDITLTTPFTFSGNIRGCDGSPQVCGNEVFSTTQLTGQGIATVQFTFGVHGQTGQPLFFFRTITYEFQAAEVPEPMTIMLLTTGLIGLGASRRRRKSRL
jgi:hypothetical protein